jgi:hypothetical protein
MGIARTASGFGAATPERGDALVTVRSRRREPPGEGPHLEDGDRQNGERLRGGDAGAGRCTCNGSEPPARATWRGDRWRLEEGPQFHWGSEAGSDRRGGDPLVRRDSGRIPGRLRGPCSAEFAAPRSGDRQKGERLRGGDAGSGRCTRDGSEPPARPTRHDRQTEAKRSTQRTRRTRRCAGEGLGAVGSIHANRRICGRYRPRAHGAPYGMAVPRLCAEGGHGPRGTGYAARRADAPTPSRTSRIDPAEPKKSPSFRVGRAGGSEPLRVRFPAPASPPRSRSPFRRSPRENPWGPSPGGSRLHPTNSFLRAPLRPPRPLR